VPAPEAKAPPPISASAPEAPAEVAEASAFSSWTDWLLGVAALLVLFAAGAWIWSRRQREELELEPQVVERPKIQPRPEPTFKPDSPASPSPSREAPLPTFGTGQNAAPSRDGSLSLAIEARQLSISLTAATLSYRITLTNSGKTSLRGIAIAGDMIGAHASRSQAEQIASAESPLSHCHSIESIPAGQSVQVTGDFRLPLPMIQPIRRGELALFVPLARLRVEATEGGNGAIVKTALIGQRSPRPGAGLQPFRLDLGPRIYREVTQKIFS